MSSSLLDLIRSGPAAPNVALLPDAHFFVRTVPLGEGTDAAAVAQQAELTLETLSPFPATQLYAGHYWVPGAGQMLVYAAYRRRFTDEQTALWAGAEWVAPTFASVLGLEFKPATTVLIPGAEAWTAISWDKSPVPRLVLVRPVPPEATPEQRLEVREALVREIGGTVQLVELPAVPQIVRSPDEDELAFQAGEQTWRLRRSVSHELDVRPKEELAQLRRGQRRDVLLWRVFLGAAAVLGLLVVGEAALVGGRMWHRSRQAVFSAQRPVVQKIMTAQSLANRIDELSTRRLLPFEMIGQLSQKKPESVKFIRTSTVGLHGMEVEAQTANAADYSAYKAALDASPSIAGVEVREERSRDQLTTFILLVKFKPEALKPASS